MAHIAKAGLEVPGSEEEESKDTNSFFGWVRRLIRHTNTHTCTTRVAIITDLALRSEL